MRSMFELFILFLRKNKKDSEHLVQKMSRGRGLETNFSHIILYLFNELHWKFTSLYDVLRRIIRSRISRIITENNVFTLPHKMYSISLFLSELFSFHIVL